MEFTATVTFLIVLKLVQDYRGANGESIPRVVTEGQRDRTPSRLARLSVNMFPSKEDSRRMPRGITPRQPARTGRQEGARSQPHATRKGSVRSKDARVGTGAPA